MPILLKKSIEYAKLSWDARYKKLIKKHLVKIW